jgi:hypothetical protein
MEAVTSFDVPAKFYRITQRHSMEEYFLHSKHRDISKSKIFIRRNTKYFETFISNAYEGTEKT